MNTKKDIRPILYALYCAGIVAMNVLAAKQIDILGLTVTCGIFVSGFVFMAQDLITEFYGTKEARKMVFSCYGISLIMTLLYQLAIAVPPSQFWSSQDAFATVLQTTLRITIASIIAYTAGSFVNVSVMGGLKKRFPNSLFVRAIGSTVVGQLLDNGLFAVIAFTGVLPVQAIATMTVGGTLIEIITEIVCFPILKIATKRLSRD
jgi:uncharacterized integral membrane protein (TIGR00697 family)